MASSSTDSRASDEWVRTPRPERQYISDAAPHDYVVQASWRGAANPGSTVSNYPRLTPPHRPHTSQLLSPDSRTSQVTYNQPEMYTHSPSYTQDARFIPMNASNQPLVENPGHDTRYPYSSVPAYPTSPYHHVINPPPFPIEPNTSPTLPPARPAPSTIAIEPATRDEERRQQVYVQSPIPVPFTPPAQNPSVDFEQVLRSYEHVLGSLPSVEAWVDDQARKGYSAATLGGLVSTAVAGLRTLDPTARFVPCEMEHRRSADSSSPPRSSNTNPPGSRSKRRRAIQKCLSCDSTSTPEWRKGPMGPRTLCNACGLVWAKVLRKRALEERGKEYTSKPAIKSSSSNNSRSGRRSSPFRGSQHPTKSVPS